MDRWSPCKRKDFISKLRKLGFGELESGTRHGIMRYGSQKQVIPSNAEFSVPQVKKLIRQVEEKIGRQISAEEWEQL